MYGVLGQSVAELRTHYGVTTLHPLGMVAIAILGICILTLSRRYATVPLIIIACCFSPAQRVVIGGLDFTLVRIIIIFASIRVIYKKEYLGYKWRTMDSLLVAWCLSSIVIYTLQFGNMNAFFNRSGMVFGYGGCYFFFRCTLRKWGDIQNLLKCSIILGFPLALLFLVEKYSGRNMFSVFGGIPEFTLIREGKLRCQGPFPHPIMAGCFWAAMIPLIGSMAFKRGHERMLGISGFLSASVIIVCCASSTPVMSVILGAFAVGLYWLRKIAKHLAFSVAFIGLALHIGMNKGVWNLMSKINIIGGSTGWHRFYLIDKSIERINEWWLLGTKSTMHWGWGLRDVTNQYILEGVRGGLITMLLFLAIIAVALKGVFAAVHHGHLSRERTAIVWAFGASLIMHCVNFMAVAYFGQIFILWFLTLAVICALPELNVDSVEVLPTLKPLRANFKPWQTGKDLAGQRPSPWVAMR